MSTLEKRSAARQPSVAPPLAFRWEGDGFKPVGRYAQECDRYFTVGVVYRLVEHFDRSGLSHRHEFAELREAFDNLPEHLAELFPNAEALRKFCLVKAGFCDAKQVVCPSKAFAVDLHRQLSRDYDFAAVNGNVVTFFTAHSQSYRAMDRKTFQASKTAILDVLAGLLGTSPKALSDNAERAA
jgi:hypothetical protein